MSHELETVGGRTSFAFNKHNGDPWHTLGNPVDGDQPLPVMLKEAAADFIVERAPIYVMTPGGMIEDPDYVATVRKNPHFVEGSDEHFPYQRLGVVQSTYGIVQNETVFQRALDIVGASQGEAAIDTLGVLFDGRQVFGYLDCGVTSIDPGGINDKVEHGLAVWSSHDGSMAVSYAVTDTRAVCHNTISWGFARAKRTFKARHTSQVQATLADAATAMDLRTRYTEAFVAQCEALLATAAPASTLDKVLEGVFPTPGPDATQRSKDHVTRTHDAIRRLYEGPNNAGGFGRNGWTVYNAVGEFLDHYRKGTPEALAYASMSVGSWVDQAKAKTAGLILATV